MIVIRRLSIRVAPSRRGDALFLGRSCGEALAARLVGADALAPNAKIRLDGARRPVPLLARDVAAMTVAAVGRKDR